MLLRPTISPMMRVAMTGGSARVVALGRVQLSGFPTNTAGSLLLKNHRPMISAALLTTQSHGSPTFAAASSLRSLSRRHHNKLTPLPPNLLLPYTHNSLGALAVFSTGGPGKPPQGGGRMGMAGGLLGAGALLMGKTKYLIAALKLTKFSSLASMFLSFGAYSMFFGWPYAAGVVGLIFVHETGHLLVMNHYNVPFSPMVFLPFMGAVVAMRDHPQDAWQDAMIAFGGPALGTVGAMGVAVGAQMTDSQLLYALADFGFFVNLFNMLPLGSMDGGRITGALSPWFGVGGLAGGAGLIATGAIGNPLVYLIWLAGAWETFQRFYDPAGHQPRPGYYKITNMQRGLIATGYVGLVGTLVAGMAINASNKKTPEEVRRYSELHFDEREF